MKPWGSLPTYPVFKYKLEGKEKDWRSGRKLALHITRA